MKTATVIAGPTVVRLTVPPSVANAFSMPSRSITSTRPQEKSARIGVRLSSVSSTGCPLRSSPVRQKRTISGSK